MFAALYIVCFAILLGIITFAIAWGIDEYHARREFKRIINSIWRRK